MMSDHQEDKKQNALATKKAWIVFVVGAIATVTTWQQENILAMKTGDKTAVITLNGRPPEESSNVPRSAS